MHNNPTYGYFISPQRTRGSLKPYPPNAPSPVFGRPQWHVVIPKSQGPLQLVKHTLICGWPKLLGFYCLLGPPDTGIFKMHLSPFNSFFFLFSFPHPSWILPASKRPPEKPSSLNSSGQQHQLFFPPCYHQYNSVSTSTQSTSKVSELYDHDNPMQQVHPELNKTLLPILSPGPQTTRWGCSG